MRRILILILAASCLQAATFHVIVAGLGGEPEYEARFAALAAEMDKLVRTEGVNVETLSGAKATRAAVKAALDKVADAATPEDTLVLTLIGHGTYDGEMYRFNVPGPDVTAEDLRNWLQRVKARQVVVDTSSASGAAIAALRAPNRVIITATKSGTEKNATVFARYWTEALRDGSADADKNEALSALEAYRFAAQRTARFYEVQKRLATEHSLLEDTGNGDGVKDPSPENHEGLLAAQLTVLRYGAAQEALRDPEKQKLLARKEELEQEIDKLKYEKAAMPLDEYKQKLQSLLLQLAKTQEQIDK
jgi:hypothetical protein